MWERRLAHRSVEETLAHHDKNMDAGYGSRSVIGYVLIKSGRIPGRPDTCEGWRRHDHCSPHGPDDRRRDRKSPPRPALGNGDVRAGGRHLDHERLDLG